VGRGPLHDRPGPFSEPQPRVWFENQLLIPLTPETQNPKLQTQNPKPKTKNQKRKTRCTTAREWRASWTARCHALHPTPCTRHPAPYTLHPTPCTLHPAPYTLHPTPYTLHLKPEELNPNPQSLNSRPQTPHHKRKRCCARRWRST